jgi:hypothetical protein
MKNLLTFSLSLLMAASLWAQKTPAGYNISDADCASGGDNVYFFEDGRVVSSATGAGSIYVQEGTWQLSGREVKVTYTKEYVGVPDGKLLYVASVEVYEKYKAAATKIDKESTFAWYDGIADLPQEDCGTLTKHEFADNSDVHIHLRTGFVGKFNASDRLLTEAELRKYSAWDLKIMRNEIFARYGYTFTSKEMKDYFEKQPLYTAIYTDVTPFLSDIEQKNIALIKKLEASK